MSAQYFNNRKSCRFFKNNSISLQQINEIISLACKAPTCGNMQLYSVIVTLDETRLKSLAQMHYNQPAATTAPAILTVCADFNRFTRWCEINHADAGYDNFHSFIMAMTDAVIFSQQIVTVAEMKGFGTCYLGTVTYNATEISEFLEVPELVVPVASLAIGIPEKEGEETRRLPIDAIINHETYSNLSDDETVNLYKIHDDDPENQKYIKENKKETLAQVFAEIRYPKVLNEEISKTFMALLGNKNFLK